MTTAYVDTSYLISIEFLEKDTPNLSRQLNSFDVLVSSNLLEAEFLAVYARARRQPELANLDRVAWIYPDRPLSPEIRTVLTKGYVKGADCWHLANALYAAGEDRASVSFLTLDARQKAIARSLGFAD